MDLRAGWSRCSTGVYKVMEGVGERRGFMGRDGSRVGAHMAEIGAGTSLERLSCITTIRNAITFAWICMESVGVHVESVGVLVYTSACTFMAAHRRCSRSRASRALICLVHCLDRLAAIGATDCDYEHGASYCWMLRGMAKCGRLESRAAADERRQRRL